MQYVKRLIMVYFLSLLCASVTLAQTTDITYQGKLVETGLLANASYDFEFRLYDALSAGTLLDTRTRLAVAVSNGVFTVQLDFPTALFDGTNRYLEIAVRTAGSSGGYQQLLPRQPLTSSPYALRSLTATTADQATNATTATTATNAAQLGGVAASQYVLTTDSRLTDARNPLPNSANYVQNTTSPQASANFNISGNGTAAGTLSANAINTTTQFNLGGNRILSNPGTANLFAGVGAGSSNTTGGNNAFFGVSSGATNTTGSQNAFFGYFAGITNSTGNRNAFFGYRAGQNSTTNDNAFFGYQAGQQSTNGNSNSFFGASAGAANTSGGGNAFFGASAGAANTLGNSNAFFGFAAGNDNTTGVSNAFFGSDAGNDNTTGGGNAFFGFAAGNTNTTGSNNTIIGTFADVSTGNLSYATAIGASAVVSSSNTIVLGRSAGQDDVRVPGNLIVSTFGSAGSTDVCRNLLSQLSTCSSSLRYKTAVQPFLGGLDVVRRLRPITFRWKDGGRRDIGFAAEEVAKIEPLFATYNDKGDIEGVKYGQLTTVLINAVNQQQQLIEQQQQQLDALKRLVCEGKPKAAICREK